MTKITYRFWYLPLLLLVLFLAGTDPKSLPVYFLLIPLILLMIGVYWATTHFLMKVAPARTRQNKTIAAGLSAVALALTVLQSLNQLTIRDSFLFAAFAVLLAVYLFKLRA